MPFERAWGIMISKLGNKRTDVKMEETRRCSACGIDLVGPFRPKIELTRDSAQLGEGQETIQVAAYGWFCPTCGLLHWYADSEALGRLLNAVPMSEPQLEVSPDANYERRKQMLRLMQHIRRI